MSNKNKTKTDLPLPLLKKAVPRLLLWYGNVKKPFPWRLSPTPYHVWISEIMLQQTRIEAAIPYYERFLAALPNIEALANVQDRELMKLWEGLGYYSRARNLKKAAEKVLSNYGGSLPRTAKELQTLDGIGPYTAGAIASIAFGEPSAAVDGNVLRVITRLCACHDDILQNATREKVAKALEAVYPRGKRSGEFTQSLMELGETLCIPNGEPKCSHCPLADLCVASKEKLWDKIPVRAPKKPRRVEKRTVLLLRCGNRYALSRRSEKGLLAGMWEIPNLDGALDENGALEASRALGATPVTLKGIGNAVHIFSHVEWHMTGYLVECDRLPDTYTHATPDEIRQSYAIPKAFHAYLKEI